MSITDFSKKLIWHIFFFERILSLRLTKYSSLWQRCKPITILVYYCKTCCISFRLAAKISNLVIISRLISFNLCENSFLIAQKKSKSVKESLEIEETYISQRKIPWVISNAKAQTLIECFELNKEETGRNTPCVLSTRVRNILWSYTVKETDFPELKCR